MAGGGSAMIDDGLADLHASRTSESDTLETIIEWARNAVNATEAGMFLLHPKDALETAAPTSTRAAKAHELQLELAEGPCLEVIADDSARTFIIGDTQSDRRFPKWGAAVAGLGLRSVISTILETDDKQFGSLNLYSTEPHAFKREDMAVIEIFADRAARALEVARDNGNLVAALDTRKLVGQAQGILMERFDLDADRAFGFLVRQSQDRNVKLRAIAEWIVNNRDKPLTEMDL
jgi:GAF domain-containing protein